MSDSEIVMLRRGAETLARARNERVTSAHLLPAMAAGHGEVTELLRDFGLDTERLLSAARTSTDDIEDPMSRATELAIDVASRTRAPDPVAVHLLVALLSEPGFAARKALELCGVDIAKLRVRAMNVGLGLVGRRRIVTRRESDPTRVARAAGRTSGVAIPIFPPPERISDLPQEPTRHGSNTERALVEAPSPSPQSSPKLKRAKPRELESRFALSPKSTPLLCEIGRNLTLAAALGEIDPVVGRQVEIEQTLDILAKRQGNNPMLSGAPGVGKTSVVRGIAQRIANGDDVGILDERIIVEIAATDLLAGTGVRGALAQRLAGIRREVAAAEGRVVVFFDDIQQLLIGEAAEELAGELKTALAKGELPCIGATTPEELKKIVDSDSALARRFTVVEVEEPTREDTYLVLEALTPSLEEHHGVRFEAEALALAVGWSVRYLPGRALPDKAVSIVDLAGARARRRGATQVAAEAIAEVVSEMADLPVERLLETDRDRMLGLEELLANRVVGHEGPLRRIARILRRNAAGLGARRPIGTFLLLGPTGVGKTETAKAVAEVLFFADNAMTRIDLSEFSEPHSVARLIGAPPGYVGHEAGGQLTEAVRRRPYQVILLDEIEKAHPEVLETFLAVFDEGRLTDGRGRTVDFTNTVIIMTSNIGADETAAAPKRRVGFGNDEMDAGETENRVIAAARRTLAPEMWNRIDEVLCFAPLGREAVREIARRMLQDLARRVRESRGLHLEFDDEVVEVLLETGGYDLALGARPMKRAIARMVEAPLAEQILAGDAGSGDRAILRREDDSVGIRIVPGTLARTGDAAE